MQKWPFLDNLTEGCLDIQGLCPTAARPKIMNGCLDICETNPHTYTIQRSTFRSASGETNNGKDNQQKVNITIIAYLLW